MNLSSGYLADKLSRKYTIVLGINFPALWLIFGTGEIDLIFCSCCCFLCRCDRPIGRCSLPFDIRWSVCDWSGCGFSQHGGTVVQRRDCTSRSPWKFGCPSTIGYYIWNNGLLLDWLRYGVLATLTRIRGLIIIQGTNYIGGVGNGQHEAAWRIPLALQLVPAVILGVGILFMPFSPRYATLKLEWCLTF